MEKQAVVKAGLTCCDHCGCKCTSVDGKGKAICTTCSSTKKASASCALKSFADDLSSNHKG